VSHAVPALIREVTTALQYINERTVLLLYDARWSASSIAWISFLVCPPQASYLTLPSSTINLGKFSTGTSGYHLSPFTTWVSTPWRCDNISVTNRSYINTTWFCGLKKDRFSDRLVQQNKEYPNRKRCAVLLSDRGMLHAREKTCPVQLHIKALSFNVPSSPVLPDGSQVTTSEF
jgi:hypothetical protein